MALRICAIPSCPRPTRKQKGEKLHFFKPNEDQLEEWNRQMTENVKLTIRDRVCSLHFRDEDIIKEWIFVIEGKPVSMPRFRWTLKEGAVPQINPDHEKSTVRRSSRSKPKILTGQWANFSDEEFKKYISQKPGKPRTKNTENSPKSPEKHGSGESYEDLKTSAYLPGKRKRGRPPKNKSSADLSTVNPSQTAVAMSSVCSVDPTRATLSTPVDASNAKPAKRPAVADVGPSKVEKRRLDVPHRVPGKFLGRRPGRPPKNKSCAVSSVKNPKRTADRFSVATIDLTEEDDTLWTPVDVSDAKPTKRCTIAEVGRLVEKRKLKVLRRQPGDVLERRRPGRPPKNKSYAVSSVSNPSQSAGRSSVGTIDLTTQDALSNPADVSNFKPAKRPALADDVPLVKKRRLEVLHRVPGDLPDKRRPGRQPKNKSYDKLSVKNPTHTADTSSVGATDPTQDAFLPPVDLSNSKPAKRPAVADDSPLVEEQRLEVLYGVPGDLPERRRLGRPPKNKSYDKLSVKNPSHTAGTSSVGTVDPTQDALSPPVDVSNSKPAKCPAVPDYAPLVKKQRLEVLHGAPENFPEKRRPGRPPKNKSYAILPIEIPSATADMSSACSVDSASNTLLTPADKPDKQPTEADERPVVEERMLGAFHRVPKATYNLDDSEPEGAESATIEVLAPCSDMPVESEVLSEICQRSGYFSSDEHLNSNDNMSKAIVKIEPSDGESSATKQAEKDFVLNDMLSEVHESSVLNRDNECDNGILAVKRELCDCGGRTSTCCGPEANCGKTPFLNSAGHVDRETMTSPIIELEEQILRFSALQIDCGSLQETGVGNEGLTSLMIPCTKARAMEEKASQSNTSKKDLELELNGQDELIKYFETDCKKGVPKSSESQTAVESNLSYCSDIETFSGFSSDEEEELPIKREHFQNTAEMALKSAKLHFRKQQNICDFMRNTLGYEKGRKSSVPLSEMSNLKQEMEIAKRQLETLVSRGKAPKVNAIKKEKNRVSERGAKSSMSSSKKAMDKNVLHPGDSALRDKGAKLETENPPQPGQVIAAPNCDTVMNVVAPALNGDRVVPTTNSGWCKDEVSPASNRGLLDELKPTSDYGIMHKITPMGELTTIEPPLSEGLPERKLPVSNQVLDNMTPTSNLMDKITPSSNQVLRDKVTTTSSLADEMTPTSSQALTGKVTPTTNQLLMNRVKSTICSSLMEKISASSCSSKVMKNLTPPASRNLTLDRIIHASTRSSLLDPLFSPSLDPTSDRTSLVLKNFRSDGVLALECVVLKEQVRQLQKELFLHKQMLLESECNASLLQRKLEIQAQLPCSNCASARIIGRETMI